MTKREMAREAPPGPPDSLALLSVVCDVPVQLHHLVFLMEFALVHLRADPSIHHQIFVYDLEGVSVRQLDRTVRKGGDRWVVLRSISLHICIYVCVSVERV